MLMLTRILIYLAVTIFAASALDSTGPSLLASQSQSRASVTYGETASSRTIFTAISLFSMALLTALVGMDACNLCFTV